MRWFANFAALNLGLFVALLGVVWLVGGFDGGLGVGGTIVMLLGLLVTMGLATGLMGLLFYSDRQDVDHDVYHATDGRDGKPKD